MDADAIWWPLLLSTLAGLSTAIGGLIAVSFKPSEGMLAFLLGTAIGVMATVSGVELWWHSAVEQHDFLGITAAVAAGAVLFAVLDPLLPKHEEEHQDIKQQAAAAAAAAEVQGAGQQEQHAPVTLQTGQQPITRTGSSSARSAQQRLLICSSSSRREAPLASTPLLHEAHSSSKPSSSNSSRPSSCNNMQQQLAVLAHSADAQLEQSPLLDDGSQRDQHRKLIPESSISSDTALASCKGIACGSSTDQCQQGLAHQQQQQQQQRQQMLGEHHSEQRQQQEVEAQHLRQHHAGMLRLGLLMTITLTIHNLPEGFAVAFSAFTNIGPIMTLAIALHNIPEGLVIAAPLYAATGSKLKALGITAASGLSEPVGALLALLVFKPFVTSLAQLDYVLAVTGGVMLAVCVLELWPEGRRCAQDVRLLQGVALGTVVMGWTLYVGV